MEPRPPTAAAASMPLRKRWVIAAAVPAWLGLGFGLGLGLGLGC